MNFVPTAIPDVVLIEPAMSSDRRGFFMETWEASKFAAGGIDATFVQENHSRSTNRTLRGLHYQLPQPQGKLVRVIAGAVYDVAVDLRRSSPTFSKWVGIHLTAENRAELWIPAGFAHGFLVTCEFAEVVYKCTEFYSPEHERSLLWNDPELGIDWPLPDGEKPLLSEKDAAGKPLRLAECYR